MPIVKKGKHVEHRRESSWVEETQHSDQLYPRVSGGALPDDILLEVFDFYVGTSEYHWHSEYPWHTLVHVCKRWRCIVFSAPQRLQLQILCTSKRPVQYTLDVWPALPIVIEDHAALYKPQDANNIIAWLKQHNRVCKIFIGGIPNMFLQKIRTTDMRDPFPMLTSLYLSSKNANGPALPDSFLGGSAPRLQNIELNGIPFPGLPKLLLSTHGLVYLRIAGIPLSGYFSPNAVVTCLPALTMLQHLYIGFQSPRSREHRVNRLRPRLMRFVLPALTKFEFRGDSEYLEDIVAQIDTPQLDELVITLFNQLMFDTPLLHNFISRTETLKLPHQAKMTFNPDCVRFDLAQKDEDGEWGPPTLSSSILCRPSDWQLSSLAQISALFPLPTVDCLEISNFRGDWRDEDDMDNTQWLEVLNPFTFVEDLVLHWELVRLVTLALEDLTGERVTEVLPALQNLFLMDRQPSESVKKATGKFIGARQLSGRPVAVYYEDRCSSWMIGDW